MSFKETCYAQVHLYLVKSSVGARMLYRVYKKPLNFTMTTRLNWYIFSRIFKNNIHPGKLPFFFLSLFCFCFWFLFFFFSPDLPIAKRWNFYYLLTYLRHCDILAKNRSRMTAVIIRPNDKSTFDILTHKEKKGTKCKKEGRQYKQNLVVHCGWNFLHLFPQVVPTQDRLEGLRAFKEKRTPQYTGE